jgi:hypothetical protein
LVNRKRRGRWATIGPALHPTDFPALRAKPPDGTPTPLVNMIRPGIFVIFEIRFDKRMATGLRDSYDQYISTPNAR